MSRYAKTLEQMGIPTAPCTGINVSEYLRGWDRLYNSGMPLRYTTFPLPIAGASRQVHEAYVNGNDPVTGKPIMHQIVDALTRPLTAEEQATPSTETVVEPRLLPPDTEEQLQEFFKEKDWTDYLPVVLPTEERVAAMLKGTSHQPYEVIKTLAWPGGGRRLTVEKVAISAVMAGAKPEYFPVILAVATMAPFGNSTTSMANMIIVNGPIRNEIGMNSGIGAMGPHNRANATIGRAFTLLSKSAGNLHAGADYLRLSRQQPPVQQLLFCRERGSPAAGLGPAQRPVRLQKDRQCCHRSHRMDLPVLRGRTRDHLPAANADTRLYEVALRNGFDRSPLRRPVGGRHSAQPGVHHQRNAGPMAVEERRAFLHSSIGETASSPRAMPDLRRRASNPMQPGKSCRRTRCWRRSTILRTSTPWLWAVKPTPSGSSPISALAKAFP